VQTQIFLFAKHDEALLSTFGILAAIVGFLEMLIQRIEVRIVFVPVVQPVANYTLEVGLVHMGQKLVDGVKLSVLSAEIAAWMLCFRMSEKFVRPEQGLLGEKALSVVQTDGAVYGSIMVALEMRLKVRERTEMKVRVFPARIRTHERLKFVGFLKNVRR
jgi:hypothetical protein